jgi:hypothetical protein
MSKDVLGSLEDTKKLVISSEDLLSAFAFWEHFNVPVPEELKSAVDSFLKEPSIRHQDEVKYQICKAIALTDHEAFKDDMFKKIVEECKDIVYEMSFERDLEKALNQE